MLTRNLEHLAHRHIGGDGDRIADNAGLESLDSGHLTRLFGWRIILVDDADSAFLGDGDGKPRLGHGIHGSRHQRNVQRDATGQPG